MNRVAAYFVRRTQFRINMTTAIFGSCHVKVRERHRWSPLRLVFGPLEYTFIHPADIYCRCDWTECENKKSSSCIWCGSTQRSVIGGTVKCYDCGRLM